jgi:lysozyme
VDNKSLFDLFRKKKKDWTYNRNAGLTKTEVNEINAVVSPPEAHTAPVTVSPSDGLSSKKGPLAAIVGSLAATSLLAVVPQFEGTSYKAYRDVAGIWTVCQGDTKDVHAGLIETPEGCQKRLESQLVIHAKGVMACTPNLAQEGRDYQRVAAVSLAYNIGVSAYCHSSVDRYFDTGDYVRGCNNFMAWNKAKVNGVLRPVAGLTKRRETERNLCLKGLV